MFRELIAMKERGATEAEQAAWLAEQTRGISPIDGPRFHCPTCCDSGHLDIAHVALVLAYQRGGIDEARRCLYRVMSIRCSCPRGVRGSQDNHEPRYKPDVHCRVIGGDTESVAWWERFEAWHAEAEAESASGRDTRNTWGPAREVFA